MLFRSPLAVGAFGNYFVPLQIGAPDMAFPKLNMSSYWCYFAGGIVMMVGFFVPGGAANSGWTSYPPLSDIATTGQTVWLFGMVLLITSSLLGSVNTITTIIQLRAKGLTWMRLPFFCMDAIYYSFFIAFSFPTIGSSWRSSIDGSLSWNQFFPSIWISGLRTNIRSERWRKPIIVATSFLVLSPS